VTLVVSLRVPDGIVLAAGALALQMDSDQVCPHCKTSHNYPNIQDRLLARVDCPGCTQPFDITGVRIPPATVTQSTASYAQKMFSFLGKFGVAIYGTPILGPKTLINHLKGLERSLRIEPDANGVLLESRLATVGVTEVAQRIFEFVSERFQQAHPGPTQLPAVLLGLQIVGFDSPDDMTGKTFTAEWGSTSSMNGHDGLAPTVTGDTRIADGMLQVWQHYTMQPNPSVFSMQDAVDYAEFLISMTATAQRFAIMIPTVGGEVDIALVTSYAGFQWIKAKSLTRQLEKPFPREGL
jgi:hypothetical protein